jgi:hypothetical protein
MKIFKMGSCRTNIGQFLDKKYHFIDNYDLTHTTKEILMYLDLFDGKKNANEIKNFECLVRNPNKFKSNIYKSLIDSCDLVIIEISSLKLVEYENNFYQIVRTNENNKNKDFKIYLQDKISFREDILEISQRIKKPIIFIPHITMSFDKELKKGSGENTIINSETLSETRKLIESYITSMTEFNVKTSEIFSNYHYTEICDCSKKFDPNHYTKLGYQILTKEIEKIIDIIKNDNL